MAEKRRSNSSRILVEIAIVLSIVLSVFGALLLTQQEQAMRTGSVSGSTGVTEFAPATDLPMTPTPTPYPSVQHTSVPGSIPVGPISPAPGSTDTSRPMTPTPTLVAPATTVGWSE